MEEAERESELVFARGHQVTAKGYREGMGPVLITGIYSEAVAKGMHTNMNREYRKSPKL